MKKPVHYSDVPAESWYEGTDREIYGRPLCDIGGKAKVGVGFMTLPPGSNTKPAHWHSEEEEHLYALSGRSILFLGDERFELSQGCYVCFPAGQQVEHYLENTGDENFEYIIIGERVDGDVVTYANEECC